MSCNILTHHDQRQDSLCDSTHDLKARKNNVFFKNSSLLLVLWLSRRDNYSFSLSLGMTGRLFCRIERGRNPVLWVPKILSRGLCSNCTHTALGGVTPPLLTCVWLMHSRMGRGPKARCSGPSSAEQLGDNETLPTGSFWGRCLEKH